MRIPGTLPGIFFDGNFGVASLCFLGFAEALRSHLNATEKRFPEGRTSDEATTTANTEADPLRG